MKRFEFLFEKGFLDDPIKGRIIELGDENDTFEPVITVTTFAYKIFLSDKPIEDLQQPFELPEYMKEKTFYFGQRYTVEDYIKRFPKNVIDEHVKNYSNLFDVVQASPVGVPFCFPISIYKFADVEIIDYKKARKVNVSANSDITKNHKSLYAF